ncbi:type II toxin-antitoxin system HicB family antitoxin [Ignatzschineria rhizosphaerae]|uniref:Type II toxin-antitoxin system HicB family antitoxin n=1 Tax=Ignatzschineria rhizosphaerae TaxID=2923279 RepID=A0ABY3X308_9GAMM|nr:type II toxin-antitoxin system HicB family antitoxin [Ignatzschineria rhizosphaerae]UNM96650.1 type II toxin-antitoxin system HicB family antitoxin [Ignatzschineria rhizosphaerae]
MLFHLVIHKDEDSTYGVTIPSLEGAFSHGDTLEEAVLNSKEAIQFHLEGILEDGIEPDFKHLTLDEIKTNPDYQGADLISVDIDTSAYTLKPERFNVSWPRYLIKEVDQYTTQHPDTRSSFLAKAAKKYIEQNP